jgi:hypothetical protein
MSRLWPIVLAIIAGVFLSGAVVANAAEPQGGGKSTVATPAPSAEKLKKRGNSLSQLMRRSNCCSRWTPTRTARSRRKNG